MLGGEVGKSARLNRPCTAWQTLIQVVGFGGRHWCIACIMFGKACPGDDGQGRAWDSILKELPSMLSVLNVDTTS